MKRFLLGLVLLFCAWVLSAPARADDSCGPCLTACDRVCDYHECKELCAEELASSRECTACRRSADGRCRTCTRRCRCG